MSRAFVKEDDGTPMPPPLERPISAAPNLVTRRGARLIDEAIASLETEIAAAPDEESTEPLRRDLRYWQSRRATAQLMPPEQDGAGFATRVTIRRGGKKLTIAIVGEDEADPAEGRIAWTAPLARAIDGAEPGDTVEMEAGGRREPIAVLAVEPLTED